MRHLRRGIPLFGFRGGSDHRVRCRHCGAVNDDIELCRICRLSLPGAAELRQRGGAVEPGPPFEETVENEEAVWREYREEDSLLPPD